MGETFLTLKVLVFSSALMLIDSASDINGNIDYTLKPGHLQPLGSKQPQWPIQIATNFPEPADFFENYVDKSKPLLIKGAAKRSPAFALWSDEYLLSSPKAASAMVFVENRKKENRTEGGQDIPLKQFIENYKKNDIYMVNGVPDHLQKDVLLPAPLRCEETKKYYVDTVLWFSSGGTKSVLHNDDVDNINCLFRGRKQLMFIEYPKYINQVLIDKPVGGYSEVDVDKVDFTKYKGLAEVEFVNATMEEGDCLFIPFKWFHQVNSYNNENNQNVAVNVWFKHVRGHRPKDCKVSADEATLDKFVFADLERQKREKEMEEKTPEGGEGDGDNDGRNVEPSWIQFEESLKRLKSKKMDFTKFTKVFQRDQVGRRIIGKFGDDADAEITEALRSLFDILDANKDQVIEISDFDEHMKNPEDTDALVENQLARIEDIIEDIREKAAVGKEEKDKHKGKDEL